MIWWPSTTSTGADAWWIMLSAFLANYWQCFISTVEQCSDTAQLLVEMAVLLQSCSKGQFWNQDKNKMKMPFCKQWNKNKNQPDEYFRSYFKLCSSRNIPCTAWMLMSPYYSCRISCSISWQTYIIHRPPHKEMPEKFHTGKKNLIQSWAFEQLALKLLSFSGAAEPHFLFLFCSACSQEKEYLPLIVFVFNTMYLVQADPRNLMDIMHSGQHLELYGDDNISDDFRTSLRVECPR